MNLINQWEELQKGENQILKVQWGGGGGITIFGLNLVGGKTLEETMLTFESMSMSHPLACFIRASKFLALKRLVSKKLGKLTYLISCNILRCFAHLGKWLDLFKWYQIAQHITLIVSDHFMGTRLYRVISG